MSDGAPARDQVLSDTVLPCGRSTEEILDQVATGRGDALDAHQATCVHCRAALAETERLWAPVRALSGRVETPPPGLVDAVMAAVRALAREVWHVVLPGERGWTRIAARVIAEVAQLAASRVPGVRVALGRESGGHGARRTARATRAHQADGTAVGVAGQFVTIDLAIVVGYGTSIAAVAQAVRDAVRADLSRLVSAESTRVDIYVDDVLPPVAPRPGGGA